MLVLFLFFCNETNFYGRIWRRFGIASGDGAIFVVCTAHSAFLSNGIERIRQISFVCTTREEAKRKLKYRSPRFPTSREKKNRGGFSSRYFHRGGEMRREGKTQTRHQTPFPVSFFFMFFSLFSSISHLRASEGTKQHGKRRRQALALQRWRLFSKHKKIAALSSSSSSYLFSFLLLVRVSRDTD